MCVSGTDLALTASQQNCGRACGSTARPVAKGGGIQMSKMKNKGDGYERELAAYINEYTGLHSSRAPLSGGGAIGILSGGADLLGTPSIFIEAKRVERLNFHDAMRQAERNIQQTQSPDIPIVINRKNRMPTGRSLCLMHLLPFFLQIFFESRRLYRRINTDGPLPLGGHGPKKKRPRGPSSFYLTPHSLRYL